MRRIACAAMMALLPACVHAAATYPYCIGGRTLHLERADTPQARTQGLMYRTELASDGMYFDLGGSFPARMWMKDTPLSLDMLFIDATGKLVHIVPDTTPYSTDIIASPSPVSAVIELEAGRAAKEGIYRGAAVRHGACVHN